MTYSGRLRRGNSQVTSGVIGRCRSNPQREGCIIVTGRDGVGDVAIGAIILVIAPEVDDRIQTTTHIGTAPRSRQRDSIITGSAASEVGTCYRAKELINRSDGLGAHLKGVAGHILGGRLVGPVGTELGEVDVILIGRQHHGSELHEIGLTIQVHGNGLGIGSGDSHRTSVGAVSRRCVSDIDSGIVGCTGDDIGLVDGELIALDCQSHIAFKIGGAQRECLGHRCAHSGLEVQRCGISGNGRNGGSNTRQGNVNTLGTSAGERYGSRVGATGRRCVSHRHSSAVSSLSLGDRSLVNGEARTSHGQINCTGEVSTRYIEGLGY